jgi:hypothetical protein
MPGRRNRNRSLRPGMVPSRNSKQVKAAKNCYLPNGTVKLLTGATIHVRRMTKGGWFKVGKGSRARYVHPNECRPKEYQPNE